MKKTMISISFILAILGGSTLLAIQPEILQGTEKELQIDTDNNIVVLKVVTNKLTEIRIIIMSSITNMPHSELVFERGDEVQNINIGEGFSVKTLITAKNANICYALIERHYKANGRRRVTDEKLISIQLPKENQPLDSSVINTIFNMDDLDTENGRSWVSDLKDVSADGRRLLVEKSEPHKLNNSTTTWEYKIMIFDVPQKTFSDLDWK